MAQTTMTDGKPKRKAKADPDRVQLAISSIEGRLDDIERQIYSPEGWALKWVEMQTQIDSLAGHLAVESSDRIKLRDNLMQLLKDRRESVLGCEAEISKANKRIDDCTVLLVDAVSNIKWLWIAVVGLLLLAMTLAVWR